MIAGKGLLSLKNLTTILFIKKTVDEKTNTNKPSLAASNSSLDAFLKKDPVIGASFKKPFVNRKSFSRNNDTKEVNFSKAKSFKTVSRTRTDDFKNEIKPIYGK